MRARVSPLPTRGYEVLVYRHNQVVRRYECSSKKDVAFVERLVDRWNKRHEGRWGDAQ